jgi:hypothetical protein
MSGSIVPEEGFTLDLALLALIKDKSSMEAIYDHQLKVLRSSIREAKSKSKVDIHTYANKIIPIMLTKYFPFLAVPAKLLIIVTYADVSEVKTPNPHDCR